MARRSLGPSADHAGNAAAAASAAARVSDRGRGRARSNLAGHRIETIESAPMSGDRVSLTDQ